MLRDIIEVARKASSRISMSSSSSSSGSAAENDRYILLQRSFSGFSLSLHPVWITIIPRQREERWHCLLWRRIILLSSARSSSPFLRCCCCCCFLCPSIRLCGERERGIGYYNTTVCAEAANGETFFCYYAERERERRITGRLFPMILWNCRRRLKFFPRASIAFER